VSRLCSRLDFKDVIRSEDGVFVLFYASWCPFSLAFLPIYEKKAKGRDSKFIRILLDGNEDLFDEHAVEVYPTVLFFKGGAVARRLDGRHLAGLKEAQLTELIDACGFGRE
jgi:thiol-disulfide isomerase/thioredoxin